MTVFAVIQCGISFTDNRVVVRISHVYVCLAFNGTSYQGLG